MRASSAALLLLLGTCTTATHPSAPTIQRRRSSWQRLSDPIIDRFWGSRHTQFPLNDVSKKAGNAPDISRKITASYLEDVVLRFNISTYEEAASLKEACDDLFLDVWEFTRDWADVRVSKEVSPSLLGLLPKSLQSNHRTLMTSLDLSDAIVESYPSPATTSAHDTRRFSLALDTTEKTESSENIFFQNYQPLSVITPWMNLLASMFPTHVRLVNIGISYEGRDIPGLRVGVHPTNSEQEQKKRKTILVVGGSHAREWISTSTVNYVAWSLITSYGKDIAITNLLEAYDWVFIPTLNPDGYTYSWETDRLWRKTRQPTSVRFCKGLDIDRSYDFQFDDSAQSNPCSESFGGTRPLESVEANRFTAWAKNETENNNVEFVTFLDLHSYSQQVLYPYSYTCHDEPPSLEDLEELALGLAKAIRNSRSGHFYQTIPACEGNVATLTPSSSRTPPKKSYFPRLESGGGSALDWFYHELKVKYAFQIKLRDTGSYGFLLPKEYIIPTGREILDAALYLGKYLMGEVGMEQGNKSAQVYFKDLRGARQEGR